MSQFLPGNYFSNGLESSGPCMGFSNFNFPLQQNVFCQKFFFAENWNVDNFGIFFITLLGTFAPLTPPHILCVQITVDKVIVT